MSSRFAGFRWPTPSQLLLLRAATGDSGAAARAWEWWSSLNSLDEIDRASQRLMPQVAENLGRYGIECAESARLKGLLHRAWYENKLAIHAATGAVRVLSVAGIESMLLKGGALLATGAGTSAARSMSDIDLLVHEADAAPAVAVLCTAGWRPTAGKPSGAQEALKVLHAVELRSAGGLPLDLHRSMLEDNPRPGADVGAWRRSREVALGGVQVRVPCYEDLLVGVCVHGARATPGPTVRWVLDARDILQDAGESLDWELLLRISRARRCSLAMSEALEFLSEEVGIRVSLDTRESFRESRRGWLERLDHRAQGQKDRAGWAVASSFTRYLRQASGRGPLQTLTGLPRFLQYLWGLESARQVPGAGLRRLYAHISGRHPLRAQRG